MGLTRHSIAEHEARMTATARQAIVQAMQLYVPDVDYDLAKAILDALRAADLDYCVLCCYKQKAPTGAGAGRNLESVDAIKAIVLNPQRDGDDGSPERRDRHYSIVLRAFFDAGATGLTDEELHYSSNLFSNTAQARRAELMRGGWIEAVEGEKRLSMHNRPMTVWKLTRAARTQLMEWGWIPAVQAAK